jgi:hypothetical protein
MASYEQAVDALRQRAKVAKAKRDKVEMARVRREFERLKEARGGPSYAGGLLRSALGQGLGMGFGDEIEAYALSKLHGTDYEAELQHARDLQDRWASENPVSNIASQIGGGMVPGIGIAKGVGMAAKGASRLKQLMGAGAAEGAVLGAGTAEGGPEDRLKGAAIGAGIGLGGGAVARGAERMLSGRAQRLAANKLETALRDAGYQGTPSDVAYMARRAVEDLGADAILADVDAATRRLMGSAVRATRSPENVESFIRQRQRAASGRVSEQVAQVSGVRESALQARDRMAGARRQQAQTDYGRIRGEAVNATPGMRQALTFPEGQRAAQSALDTMRMEYNDAALSLDDAIHGLDFWDKWQQAMRSQVDAAAAGADRYRASLIGDMRQRVLAELDAQPGVSGRMGADYATARANYRTASKIEEGVDAGEKFLKMTPEELQREMSGMTAQERQALVIGAIDKLQRQVMMSPDSANVARNLVKSMALRQKFEILLGPQQADDLLNRMAAEMEKNLTDTALIHGSPTASRMAADQGNAEAGMDAALGSLLAGEPVGAARAAAGAVARNMMPKGMAPSTADELLKILGETDPARLEQLIEAALRGMPIDERIMPALMGGAGAALAPAARPETGYDPYRMVIEITPP